MPHETQTLEQQLATGAATAARDAQCGRALTYEDIHSDVQRITASLARKYTDESCVELHFDNLCGEGNLKIAKLVTSGYLEKYAGRRGELFKWIKACLNNHIRSIVQRNRFTVKRTGMPSPPRGEIDWGAKPRPKPEISLDDPDAHVRLPDALTCDKVTTMVEDMRELLKPVEFLVFSQLTSPNEAALNCATLEAAVGRDRPRELKVSYAHMADGIGLSLEAFKATMEAVQEKVKTYMQNGTSDPQSTAAVSALEAVFNLQIPRSTEPLVVKRLLTIAARANDGLVTAQVRELLALAGAKPPELDTTGQLSCYGVLHSPTNRICQSCGLRTACSVETSNFGLDTVVLSPRAIPARALVRTATLTGEPPAAEPEDETVLPLESASEEEGPEPAVVAPAARKKSNGPKVDPKKRAQPQSARDEVIYSTLLEQFKPVLFSGELYLKHATARPDGVVKHVFWLGRKPGMPFALRFCGAQPSMLPKLVQEGKSWYAKPDMPADDLLKLMRLHADFMFKVKK